MIAAVFALLAVLVVAAAALCVYEYRLYTPEQRALAPRLSQAYLLGVLLEGLLGVALLVWIATGRFPPWAAFSAASALALVVVLLQRRMLAAMGVDESPLVARLDW